MNKYRVEFERVETGYVEVFANNEDHAISVLYKQRSYSETVETDDVEYKNPIKVK